MRAKGNENKGECGFVFSYQVFSVGEAHHVPAILISSYNISFAEFLFSVVALRGQSPEEPQFHLQKTMATHSSYKSISKTPEPHKAVHFSP